MTSTTPASPAATEAPTRRPVGTNRPEVADATDLAAEVADLGGRWGAVVGSPDEALTADGARFAERFLAALEGGVVRAAEPDAGSPGGWRVNTWVKQGILLCFRVPGMRDWRDTILVARDRSAFGVLDLLDSDGARAATAGKAGAARDTQPKEPRP